MNDDIRVVFDCNTFLQALAAPDGPAGRCVQLAFDHKIHLFISPTILEEFFEVTQRPKVIAKLHLTSRRTQEIFQAIQIASTILASFPAPFSYARDTDDAHYVTLAL